MAFFKNKLSTLLIVILFMTSSCIRSSRDAENQAAGVENNSDFIVLEVKGQSVAINQNDEWKIPTQKTYEYRTCLISRRTNSPLPSGQIFNIVHPNRSQIEVKTDNLGCLVWQESVPFNFTADSVYIEKVRRIEGHGSYRGQAKLRYAINPWLTYRGESGDEVVDLNRGNSNIADRFLLKEAASDGLLAGIFSRDSGRKLQIELSPSLEIFEKGYKNNKRMVQIILRTKPFIEPLKMNGEPSKTSIERGQFKVYVQLVGNYLGNKSEKLILTPELAPKVLTIRGEGVLSFEAEVPLSRQVTTGQVQLALKIEPINAPFDLNPYEGLHNIGSFQSLLKNTGVTQVEGDLSENRFNYSSFIESSANFTELKESHWAHDLPPVEYSNLEPRFVQVKPGETSTDRTILYRVSTQVTDGLTGAPIIKQPFVITHPDGRTEDTTSDHTGNIYWRDELSHKYYVREHRILEKVKITHKASQKSENYTIALNPWDEGWTFGGDLRSKILGDDYKFTEQKPNQLMVDAFRYQTIRFRYVIDEFLTLNVQKAVVMALDPLVQRDTLYRGRIFEPLRDGVYLAKIALVKYYIDPFKEGRHLIKDDEGQYAIRKVGEGGKAEEGEYTTVVKKLLRVQAGRITTPLEFSMRDLRMMSIRSNIMVEIETIDENRLMTANIVEQKISELEKEYEALHAGNMTEAEKEAYLSGKRKELESEKDLLQAFVETELESLKRQREETAALQRKRFELVDRIEKGEEQGSPKEIYEKEDSLLSLSRGDFEKVIANARANLGQIELSMKQYWSEWDQGWEQAKEELIDEKYVFPSKEMERSYLDYVLIMQNFLDNEKLGSVVTESDIERLKANNYTVNPAAPIIDLNLYRNKSGLQRRTFIGPCTLVANDNMSEMRPTNTIDEKYCERVDCSEELYEPRQKVDNTEFENSAYHDSLKPFENMHVDEVIIMHKKNEDKYVKEMDALSQIGNFVEAYNLSFVSLSDEPLLQYKKNCKFAEGEECFLPNESQVKKAAHFIKDLNLKDPKASLGRYFFVNPIRKLEKLNNTFLEERNNELEPLTNRFLRELVEMNGSFAQRGRFSPNYIPSSDTEYFVDAENYINYELNGKVENLSKDDLRMWLKQGASSLRLIDAVRICEALTENTVAKMVEKDLFAKNSFLSGDKVARAKNYLLEVCFSKVQYMPKSKEVMFRDVSFDRRYKILETGQYKQLSGKNMNLNVDVGFGISSYKDISTVESIGLNKMAIFGLATAGLVAVTVGLPVTVALGVTGLGGMLLYSGSVNDASGTNMGQATSINAAAFLVIQKAELEITINRHEKCLTTQFSKNFAFDLRMDRLHLKDGVDLKNQDLFKALTQGFLICEGDTKINNEPEKVIENYYYVTQHFTAGDMLDDVNLLNHAWLLSLRGVNDFNTFISLLKAKKVNANGEVIDDNKLYDYPLSHLGNVYHQVIPTFPGLYTVPK